MARLRQIESSEIIGALPAVAALDNDLLNGAIFICALGFESRCLEIPRQIGKAGGKFQNSIILEYETNTSDNSLNRRELLTCLNACSKRVTSIISGERFGELQQLLSDQLGTPEGSGRVVFDISVASNVMLLRTFASLFCTNIDLVVVYSEAERYRPSKEEFTSNRKRWLESGTERGVNTVGVVQEYPGNHMDLLPDCVLIFPNFKPDRSRAALTFIDPSLLSKPNPKVKWFIGVPHSPDDVWREEAMRALNELNEHDSLFPVSTFDYRDTLVALETVFAPVADDYNVTVVPFGSKLQALALSMFLKLHGEIRVVSASPRDYSSDFSRGCRARWQVALGSVQKLNDALRCVGELRIET